MESFTTDFDWPDRPKASPTGTSLIQSRAGSNGNFEVVLHWPAGGLAHFWRDNQDGAGFAWHGPTLFGQGRYLGASIVEGFNKFSNDSAFGNFEVVAVHESGDLEHWFRENGGAFLWHRATTATRDVTGIPAITFTGAHFKAGALDEKLSGHVTSSFWAVAPERGGGFQLLEHRNDPSSSIPWQTITRLGSNQHFPNLLRDRQFVGVGIALTGMHCIDSSTPWSYKQMQETQPFMFPVFGDLLVAATSTDGALTVFVWNDDGLLGTPFTKKWLGGVSISLPVGQNTHELRPFRGRPSILQSDYGVDEEQDFIPFESNHFGNLELMCAAKAGGIHHFWRNNGGNTGKPASYEEGWHYAGVVGSKIYDEVSVIQSRFGRGEHGNLEVIARAEGQAGFDFFFRDEDFAWHGPQVVSATATSTSQPLVIAEPFDLMIRIGVDFSVPESDIRGWLKDPVNTPYPAVLSALGFAFGGRSLRRPIFMDVIVFNYEHAPGISSPRFASDVSAPVLIAGVLEGHNNRYGEQVSDLNQLF